MVVVKNIKGILNIPKELEVRDDDPEASVIKKIFLVENVLIESGVRIVNRTDSSITYETIDVKTDDILKDPYAFPSVKSEKFKVYFKSFSKFKNLQPGELLQLVNLKLLQILPDMFQDNAREVEDFLNSVGQMKKRLYGEIGLVQIKLSEKTKKSLIDLTPQGKYVYSLLSSIVNLQINSEAIDYLKIMKEIKLSKDLPVAHAVNPETFKPLIKVWKGLPKEQLKKFLLSESNVVPGRVNIKRPKGLTFKILTQTEEYLTVFLSKTKPVLSIRCNWKTEDTASFSDTKVCVKPVSSLIQQIQSIANISFKPIVDTRYAKVLCKIKQSAPVKNILKSFKADSSNLKLSSSNETVIVFESGRVSVDLRLIKADNSITLLISGAKQESQVFDIIDSIVNILNNVEGKTSQEIKEKTVRPFAPNCNAARKPRVARNSELTKTYHIETTAGKIVCNDNEKYQYPGYTSKNDICCFAKDQRKKPNFKGNSVSRKIIFSDENILTKPVILTDKVLQNGRLGVLPKIIIPYFSDDFNRVGVSEGTLLEAVSYATNSKFSRKVLEEEFSQELADSLDISYSSTINYLRTEKKLHHSKLLGIIQKIIKKNVIILTETSVFCEEIVDFEFKEFLLFYFTNGNYEPLVKTIDYKTLQKIFVKKELFEFFKIYHASCQIQFLPPNFAPFSYNRIKDTLNVSGQILNERGLTSFVVVKDSGILPVLQSKSLYKVKILKLKDSVVDAKTQLKLLNSMKEGPYACEGQVVVEDTTIALLTKSQILVPVKESILLETVPILTDIQYIDNDIKTKSKYVDTSSQTLKDIEDYQLSRYSLSNSLKMNPEALSKLTMMKKSTNTVYIEKINITQKILKELGVKKYLKKLSLDALNNVEILSGNLRLESLDSRNFVKRPCEVVLATQEELQDYFKK